MKTAKTIDKTLIDVNRTNAGYELASIKGKDGSFDLTPLLVGSQGTLGIVTEIMLSTEPFVPDTTLYMAGFDTLEAMQATLDELRSSDIQPSAIEFVDRGLLDQVQAAHPNLIGEALSAPFPQVVLFIEFDSVGERHLKRSLKFTDKLLHRYAKQFVVETILKRRINYGKFAKHQAGY